MTPGEALTAMRAEAPLVHSITNYVAMNFAANVLLAAGAAPAMLHAKEEAGEFAAVAAALTVNIGTISPPWVEGIEAAVAGAVGAGRPWVLDPVAHYASTWRGEVVRRLVDLRPTVIRGNASEIIALAGGTTASRGTDASDPVETARSAATALSARTGGVVAVTGARDIATDGTRMATVSGGSPLLTKVTAAGCALTALVGAYVAVAGPLDGTVAALAHFAAAGERAERDAKGPFSFAVRFGDCLAFAAPSELDGRVAWD